MGELHDAVKSNDCEKVDDLLSEGEDPNEVDEFGKTPIDYATDQDVLDSLFTYGAIRAPSYYAAKRYAGDFEMTFHFEAGLKDEVIGKLKKEYSEALYSVSEQSIEEADDGVLYDLKLMGVKTVEAGIPHYTDNYVDSFDLHDLFERCGYDVCYEGCDNSLEGQTGVFFVE